MKLLTVLLISLAALACTEANPNQIRNNNVGDITAIRIDINGKITSVINQNIINVIVALLEDTGHIDPTSRLSPRPEIPHLNDLIRHISGK